MLYLYVAALIGLLQIIDCITLLKNEGKPTRFNYFTSTAEFMWLFISFVHVFTMDRSGDDFLSPVFYIAYTVAGIITGIMMARGIEDMENLIIPKNYILTVGMCGFLYMALNIALLIP